MKNPVETIEKNLKVLRKCLRNLSCPMPMSDEEHFVEIHKAEDACDVIERAVKLLYNPKET